MYASETNSKHIRRSFISLGELAAVGIAVVFFVFMRTAMPSLPALAAEAQAAWNPALGTKTFTVGGEDYRLAQNGDIRSADGGSVPDSVRRSVLSLALFYQASADDPLLYAPRIDAAAWEAAVGKLRNARARLLAIVADTAPAATSTSAMYALIVQHPEAVYPLDFLEKFAEADRAEEDFLAHPSDEAARTLVAAQEAAASAYAASAREHAFLLDALGERNSDIFLFLGSATSIGTMKSDLTLITKNASALTQDIEKRKTCLAGDDCTGLERASDAFSDIVPTEPAAPPPYDIPLPVLTPPDTVRTIGPFSISSKCWERPFALAPKAWPMYLFESRYQDTGTALPMLANQLYYWDLRTSPYPNDAEKMKRGVVYNDQAATNLYMCNDSSYYPKIMTLAALSDIVRTEGVIADAERELISSPLPSDALLPTLADEYRRINTPQSMERLHLIENRLAGFDLVMGKLYELIGSYADVMIINKQPFDPASLLGARSSYSLLYMPFARSVWRLPEHPSFLLPGLYPLADRLIDWDELIRRGFDPYKAKVWDTTFNQQIVADMQAQQNALPAYSPGSLLTPLLELSK